MLSSRKTTKSGSRRSDRDPWTFVRNSLAAKAQSVAEIEAKLAARGVTAERAAAAVEEALRLGFLDDAELAGQLARGFRTRRYGRRRAMEALRRRGLAEPVAECAIEAAYGGEDEVELARRALGSRAVEGERARRRAVAFLVRRGFASHAAWRAVRPAEPP